MRLRRRFERASCALCYIAVSVQLGILGALVVIALALGATLSVVGIGLLRNVMG